MMGSSQAGAVSGLRSDEDRSGFAGVLVCLKAPAPLAALIAGALMLSACNVNAVLGHAAVAYKHYYAHAYGLFVVVASSCGLYLHRSRAGPEIARTLGRALPWFVLFCALIGVSVLVSNGTSYQDMASNYWDTDPHGSTSRRIGLPVLARVLGVERNGYVYFWYAVLFAAFALAWRYLGQSGLGRLETISILSSSIFAYSLVGPGYNEVLVFALGLFALQVRLGMSAKIVLATMMIATHETATPFVVLAVILRSDHEARGQWVAILGLLYLAYAAAYLLTWRQDLVTALLTAGKPSPDAAENSLSLLLQAPLRALLGVFLAYKLYWAGVLAALVCRSSRPMAMAVLSSLILAVIGTDTSRLVQFSSLAFLAAMALWLAHMPEPWRARLAVANLLVPSLYVATNAEPLWGTGLYSVYLHAAQAAGADWGRLFVQ